MMKDSCEQCQKYFNLGYSTCEVCGNTHSPYLKTLRQGVEEIRQKVNSLHRSHLIFS